MFEGLETGTWAIKVHQSAAHQSTKTDVMLHSCLHAVMICLPHVGPTESSYIFGGDGQCFKALPITAVLHMLDGDMTQIYFDLAG